MRRSRALPAACLAVALALVWVRAAVAAPDLAELQRTLRGQPEAALVALRPLLAGLPPAELRQALVFQGRMCDRVADDRCVESSAERLDGLSRRGDASAGALAVLLRALPLVREGPLGRADRLLSDAAERLPAQVDDASRLALLRVRARAKQQLGRIDEAVSLAQQAVQLSDRLGVDWQRAECRVELAIALWRAQQGEHSLAASDAAIGIARAAADPLAESLALRQRAQLMVDQGNEKEDLRATREAIRLARQAGDKREAVLGLASLSDHYLRVAEWHTALSMARATLPLAREVHDADGETVALANAGFALIELGHHDEGLALVRQAHAMTGRSGDLSMMTDIQHELGERLEHAGYLPEAWVALREFRKLADESFRRDQQQAVLELEESEDAARRRHALVLLQTENGLKEAMLTHHDLQLRIWSVAISAAGLLVALAFELLRRLRRSNARLERTNAHLREVSASDPLTGLANRRHFRALMQQQPDGGAEFRGALLLVDLDRFKDVNDCHGHAAGDAVLVEVTARVRAALRDGDLAVRWGGEEFLVSLPDLPQDQVRQLAERLLAAIGGVPVQTGREAVAVTASIGFASFPLPDQARALSWERAIDLVDQAMYCAKAQGRNRACGVVRLAGQAGAPGAGGADALLSAWRGGAVELEQLLGPGMQDAQA